MLQAVKSKAGQLALASGAMVATGMAHAVDGSFDTSSVTTAATTVATIGGVVFLVYVAIKVTQWARRAL